MKIAVGIVTYNAESTLRFDLLERTVASLLKAFPDDHITILDNGSTDGSDKTVDRAFGCDPRQGESKVVIMTRPDARAPRPSPAQAAHPDNTTPGAGHNVLLPALVSSGADLIVMSDDDMCWREDAREKLVRFWSDLHLPHDIAILGGLLEPLYPWNTPRARLECGDGAVVRDSVPGAAWTMLSGHAICLPRYPEPFKNDFGYDHTHCTQLADMRLHVCAMDLAEHIGWDASTHGNRTNTDIRSKPLDREKWGV